MKVVGLILGCSTICYGVPFLLAWNRWSADDVRKEAEEQLRSHQALPPHSPDIQAGEVKRHDAIVASIRSRLTPQSSAAEVEGASKAVLAFEQAFPKPGTTRSSPEQPSPSTDAQLVELRRHDAIVASIKDRLTPRSTTAEVEGASKALQAYEQAFPKPEIKFFGFLSSKVHYLFFLACLALGTHLTFAEMAFGRKSFEDAPWRRGTPFCRPILATASAIAAAWVSLNAIRTFVLDSAAERTIYSFVHFGLFRWWQLGLMLLMCVLMAWSSVRWSHRARAIQDEVDAWPLPETPLWKKRESTTGGGDMLLIAGELHRRALRVRTLFEEWQFHSVLLAVAFVPWTFYYWSLNDGRYYMSNLTLQALWGMLWWFVTSPARTAARAFNRYRHDVVALLLQDGAPKDTVDSARAETPLAFGAVVGSGAAAIAAYLIPILHRIF